ncbi:MAG: lipid-A-disaccharide synthase [Rhodospirillaceae bacterium]|nr:lipid-A-disaccharide synthase [Magnetovibrio sp.]MAY67495.1 lipid-A-disaccharide synthase [Rhodospirillaceae bacterium]
MTGPRTPLIYLIAGEASGDALGASLMAALKARLPGAVRFAGVGGPLMADEGLDSLFAMDDLAVMGLAEVVPRLPLLLRRMAETRADILTKSPAVVVTIDSPDFCFRVAKKLKAQRPGLPIVHYVAPTVWAWRPKRAKAVARFLDHMLCLYPFEPPYFEREGLAASFVGHPIALSTGTQPGAEARAAEFRADHGIAGDAQVLAVLPGSRGGELDRLLPVFGDSLNRLWEGGWRGRVVVPTLARHLDRLRAAAQGWPGDPLVVAGNDEKWRAFAAADTALAASGTVTLELAAAGVPTVIAYKVSGVTAAIARRLIRTPHAGLVSILLGEEVMPEFIQDDCTPDRIVPALQALLGDKMARATQRGHFKQAMAMLQGPADGPAAAAADVVAGLINRT